MSTNTTHLQSVVAAHADCFTPKFVEFIRDNEHVFKIFASLTDQLWTRGRRFYSARTIGEKMRFDHDVVSIGSDYKLNNNDFPDMARLYVLLNMDRVDMFAYRRSDDFRRYVQDLRALL